MLSPQIVTQLLSQTPHVQMFPQGRLIYVIADKQSDSGMFNNSRLLVFNGKTKTIGYTEVIPKTTLVERIDDIKGIKKEAPIEHVVISIKKDKPKALEIKCKKFIYKNKTNEKEETWVFIFKGEKGAKQTHRLFIESQCEILGKPIPLYLPQRPKSLQQPRSPFQAPRSPFQAPPEPKPQPVQEIKSIQRQPSLPIIPKQKFINSPLPSIIEQDSPRNITKPQRSSYAKVQSRESLIDSNYAKSQQKEIIQEPIDGFRFTHNAKTPYQDNVLEEQHESINKNSQIKRSNISQRNSYEPRDSRGASPQNNTKPRQQIYIVQSNVSSMNDEPLNIPPYVPSRKILKNDPSVEQMSRGITQSRFSINNKEQNNSVQNFSRIKKYDSYKSKVFESNSRISQQESINNVNYLPKHFQGVKSYGELSRSSYTKSKHQPSPKPRKKQISAVNWNRELYFSSKPFKIVNQFGETASLLVKSIIDSFITNSNRYAPVTVGETTTIYEESNIMVVIAFSLHNDADVNQAEENLEREYQAYNYLISFMKEKEKVRVPLTTLVRYKGVVAFVKAMVGESSEYPKQKFTQQLERLELLTYIPKETIVNNCNFKLVDFDQYNESTIVFIDDIYSIFPSEDGVHIAPELLRSYHQQHISSKHPTVSELIRFRNDREDAFLKSILEFQTIILSSGDFKYQFQRYGFTSDCISHLHRKIRQGFIKTICASQMASIIAVNILNSHLKHQLKSHYKKNTGNFDKSLIKFTNQYINDIFSYSSNSEQLWNEIIGEIEKQFIIKININDINWGYFLGGFLNRISLKYNVRLLDKKKMFHEEPGCISGHFVEGLVCKYETVRLESFEEVGKMRSVLGSQYEEEGFQRLKGIIADREISTYIINQHHLYEEIAVYMAEFISPVSDIPLSHSLVSPYQYPSEPASLTFMRLQLKKLKWLLKQKNQQYSVTILEESCELINYWGGEFHPLLSEFYDLFSAYYMLTEDRDQSLTLAKSSLINVIKLVGTSAVITGEKYYQLANILYTVEKREDSLNHYIKARDILKSKGLVNTQDFGFIQFRIGSLYLHFGRMGEAEESALHALNSFEDNPDQRLIDCFQLLARIYELSNNVQKLVQNGLLCSQKFNHTQDIQLFSRMTRVSIHPLLLTLSQPNKSKLLDIIQQIQLTKTKNKKFYQNWLLLKASKQNIIAYFMTMLNRIDLCMSEVKNNRGKRERSVQVRPETKGEEFVVLLESVLSISEASFFIGILRDYQY